MILNLFLKFKTIFTIKNFFKILFTLIISQPIYALEENIQYFAGKEDSNEKNELNLRNFNPDYLLGPGDEIYITLRSLPEYSGKIFINPEGNMLLPGTSLSIYVEGYSINEIKEILMNEYTKFIKNPSFSLFITTYRPVTVYVKGEVSNPGIYTLKGSQSSDFNESLVSKTSSFTTLNNSFGNNFTSQELSRGFTFKGFPTLYDALRASRGITPYSDISEIKVIRKNSKSNGGGKIVAKLNFLELFKNGDLSQNIRIFDQDVITVKKSEVVLTEQLFEANRSNLSPDFITIFISGNVIDPGPKILPKGAGLTQAVEISGGRKLLSGKIEFLRFNEQGRTEKRTFALNRSAKLNSYKNPILKDGDIINLNRSFLGKTSDVIGEFTSPLVNVYTIFKIFDD